MSKLEEGGAVIENKKSLVDNEALIMTKYY